MGRTLITPASVGQACALCFGDGKTFGAIPTPSVVTVVFSDIEIGPAWVSGDGDPPNNSYRLRQNTPCLFQDTFDGQLLALEWLSFLSRVQLTISSGVAFLSTTSNLCILTYENQLSGGSAKFINGGCEVTF